MKKKLINICLYLCCTNVLFGQLFSNNVSKVGTVAAPFLEIPVGARAVAMGGAYVSMADDATALYWNAAGIVEQDRKELIGMHSRWIAGTSFDFGGIIIPMGVSGSLGLSFTALSMEDMKVTTEDKPEGTGEYFTANDFNIGLSYAFRLTDRFAIGFTAKYIQQRIWHMTASAFAIDAGTTFKTDLFNGMVIGAVISNFGTPMRLDGRDTRRFGPADETKLGSNQSIPQNIELDSWDLPLLFQFGISTNVMKTENLRWTVAFDASHPSDNYESVNAGTELAYNEYLFMRAGYSSLFLDDNEGGLSLGFGFTTEPLFSDFLLKFDYAYRDMARLENAQFFSVAFEF